MKSVPFLLFTCEHGGKRVPPRYRALFSGQQGLLNTHRGYDIGALDAARFLQRRFRAPLVSATVTRLIVDLNRSIGHARLFSEFTRPLPEEERARILAHHYHPYRHEVEQRISRRIAGGGSVLHVSVHSFTPVLDGEVRRADLGLLYDPARSREVALAREWQARLVVARPDLVVRRNYPYRGVADGFIPALRRRFPGSRYVGIEIEINQRAPRGDSAAWQRLLAAVARTLPVRPDGLETGSGQTCGRTPRRSQPQW